MSWTCQRCRAAGAPASGACLCARGRTRARTTRSRARRAPRPRRRSRKRGGAGRGRASPTQRPAPPAERLAAGACPKRAPSLAGCLPPTGPRRLRRRRSRRPPKRGRSRVRSPTGRFREGARNAPPSERTQSCPVASPPSHARRCDAAQAAQPAVAQRRTGQRRPQALPARRPRRSRLRQAGARRQLVGLAARQGPHVRRWRELDSTRIDFAVTAAARLPPRLAGTPTRRKSGSGLCRARTSARR